MKKAESHYAVCIHSEGAEDLGIRKLYRVLPDESAASRAHPRIVDEFGEDYVLQEEWFVSVEIPEAAERAPAKAAPAPTRVR